MGVSTSESGGLRVTVLSHSRFGYFLIASAFGDYPPAMKPKLVAIVVNHDKVGDSTIVAELSAAIESLGGKAVASSFLEESLPNAVDLVISLGGDGTLLRSPRHRRPSPHR